MREIVPVEVRDVEPGAELDHPERVPLPFPRLRINRTTGAYYLRVGPSRTDVDPADPRSWQWLGFNSGHQCTHQRMADHHAWGPAWIDAVAVPTGIDATVPGAMVDLRAEEPSKANMITLDGRGSDED